MRYAADSVHVAEDEVTAEFLAGGERLFQIDACTLFQPAALCAERSPEDRFTGQVCRDPRIVKIDDGEAATVHRDAVRNSE